MQLRNRTHLVVEDLLDHRSAMKKENQEEMKQILAKEK